MSLPILFCLTVIAAISVITGLTVLWRTALRGRADAALQAEQLQKKLDAAQCDRRDLYFARVLGGGYFRSEEDLLAAGEAVGVAFPYPNYIVLAARIETWGALFAEGQMDVKDLNFILRNVLENSFSGKVHAADVRGCMAAILNLEAMPETGFQGIVQGARHALEILESEFGLTVTVAISRLYTSPTELHRAMEDTNHIFEYLDLMGEDAPITPYEALTHLYLQPSNTSFLDLETRLLGCIRAADFAGMRLVLHELIHNEFGDAKPTVDTFRFRVYGVVNTLLYLLDDLRSAVGDAVINEIDPGPRLTSAETLEEIISVMDDIMDALEQAAAQQRQPNVPAWLEHVQAFVEEHYQSPDLTVSYIADHFQITPTYCSKVFRNQYNIRLFDFIQLRRLQAAKALLKTDKSLKDIAEETGFSSALTMNRAFKRYEGSSPSKLRESCK